MQKVMINFINKNKEAETIGYLNIPPCRNNDRQYPLFIKDGELYANYKDVQINISNHLNLDDAIKVDTVLNWNDWSYQPSHVVVELNNKEIIFL